MKRFLILLGTLLCWLSTPSHAAAACTPPDIEIALREAPIVFVGQVVDVSDLGHAAEFRVVSVWKGPDLPERVFTNGRPADGADLTTARRYDIGASYLVIPHDQRMPFTDDQCTATQRFMSQGTLIPTRYQEAVGADHGRHALGGEPAEPGISGTTFVIAATAALVLAAIVIGTRNAANRSANTPSNGARPGPTSRAALGGVFGGPGGKRSLHRLRRRERKKRRS